MKRVKATKFENSNPTSRVTGEFHIREKGKDDDRVSLSPLTPKQALRGPLATPPVEKRQH